MNRPLGASPLQAKLPVRVKYEDINPSLNELSWQHIASYKFEKVGGPFSEGGWSSTAPKDHWSRQLPNPFGFDTHFYIHPEHPDELARVTGAGAVEHVVYIFRKK
jgi:hypothetical protein